MEHLHRHIYDKKCFSARGLGWLSRASGLSSLVLVEAGAVLLAVCLTFGEAAFFVANALLIAYPILATYVYPEERPTRDLLLVYWSCLGALTVFDRFLESVPLYYLSKFGLMALFFLEPVSLAEKINKLIEWKLEEANMLTPSEFSQIRWRNGRSPLPPKPVDRNPPLEEVKSATAVTWTLQPLPEPVAQEEKLNTARQPTASSTRSLYFHDFVAALRSSPAPKEHSSTTTAERSSLFLVHTPAEQVTTAIWKTTPTADGRQTPNHGMMAVDSVYRMKTDGPGIENRDIVPANDALPCHEEDGDTFMIVGKPYTSKEWDKIKGQRQKQNVPEVAHRTLGGLYYDQVDGGRLFCISGSSIAGPHKGNQEKLERALGKALFNEPPPLTISKQVIINSKGFGFLVIRNYSPKPIEVLIYSQNEEISPQAQMFHVPAQLGPTYREKIVKIGISPKYREEVFPALRKLFVQFFATPYVAYTAKEEDFKNCQCVISSVPIVYTRDSKDNVIRRCF